MALILLKKSSFRRWYEKNREGLSEKRKKLYAEDLAYRERALESSRRYRRGERTLTRPSDDALISFREAAARTGVGVSTLHSWRSNQLFPEPKHHNGALWFTEKQLFLLKDLKVRVYGKRRWYMKSDRFEEVIGIVSANWD